MNKLIHLVRDENGSVLIEFALYISFFVIFMMGIIDYSMYIHYEMELTEGAAAGAQLGTYPGQQKNIAGMQTVALKSTPDLSGVQAVANYFYSCTPGGPQVTSTASCSAYTNVTTPLMYVQVKTTATVPATLRFTGVSSSLALQGLATYRVPWTQ